MSNTVYIILFFLLIIFVRGFIVVFHELGHALTGLALYKGNFDVYIGSYGDPTKGWHFKVGRLNIHFSYNPVDWDRGLCVSTNQADSYKRQLLYILGGSIGSLILGLLFLSLLLIPIDEILKVYAFLAFFYAFADFLNNIIPKPKPITLFNGGVTYNDGFQLKTIIKEKKDYGASARLIEFYTKKEYKEGLECFESLNKPIYNPLVLRIAAYMYLSEKKSTKAVENFELLRKLSVLTADDHCNFGLSYSYLDSHLEALEQYKKALYIAPNHIYALNNRGYAYNLTGEYEKAILDFNKVIQINPEFAYAYNNRGFSKIKLGSEEEGFKDIEKSLELDATNAFAYRNKGIYYLEKKNYPEAYSLFLQAKDLDASTHLIDEYLEETRLLMD